MHLHQSIALLSSLLHPSLSLWSKISCSSDWPWICYVAKAPHIVSACSKFYTMYCPSLTNASFDDALSIATPAKVGVFTLQEIGTTTSQVLWGLSEESLIESLIRTAMRRKRESEYRSLEDDDDSWETRERGVWVPYLFPQHFCFRNKVWWCSPGWLGTHFVDQGV